MVCVKAFFCFIVFEGFRWNVSITSWVRYLDHAGSWQGPAADTLGHSRWRHFNGIVVLSVTLAQQVDVCFNGIYLGFSTVSLFFWNYLNIVDVLITSIFVTEIRSFWKIMPLRNCTSEVLVMILHTHYDVFSIINILFSFWVGCADFYFTAKVTQQLVSVHKSAGKLEKSHRFGHSNLILRHH